MPLARAAEEAGYDGMVIPDSLCYPKESDSTYPFSPDHTREFLEDKPFIEPFSLIPALGVVTERLRFITFVLKLPMRHPLLVAKQASSVAVMTDNRLALGVGSSPWPEDYELVDVPWEGRGRRMDEAMAIVQGLSAGGYFEYHGEVYDLPPVKISPTPTEPLPILVGGHATPALRRAARSDGWLHGGGDPADLPGLLERLGTAAGGGGDRGPAVRGPRDLARRLLGRRHPPSRGAGCDRRDRGLPLALCGRPGHRGAPGQAGQPASFRRRRHRQGAVVTTARELGQASMAAVESKDREAWLALFADDGVVEDPIGPSAFDPEGRGHRGRAAIAAFYDTVIAANESITFDIRQSFLCGDEAANVGVIRIDFAGGSAVEVDGIYIYRRSPDDKIASLRAFWEPDAVRSVP